MFGKGLVKGMQITWKEFWAPKATIQYPEHQNPIPDRFHGRFVLDLNNCIACGMCANACPNKVISLRKQKVGTKQFLTNYVMNIQYCMFCGLCVESCPKDALHFSKVINMNQYFYNNIPLVLVQREAPAEPVEKEKPAAKPTSQPKADKSAPTAKSEVAASKASDKEGE